MAPKVTSSRAEASRKYYEENRETILAKQKARRQKVNETNRTARAGVQDRVKAIKESTPCADCGVKYPYYVMDFDHVRGTKVTNVARLVSALYSWSVIKEEIDKCDVVCSNCHRERTQQRR